MPSLAAGESDQGHDGVPPLMWRLADGTSTAASKEPCGCVNHIIRWSTQAVLDHLIRPTHGSRQDTTLLEDPTLGGA